MDHLKRVEELWFLNRRPLYVEVPRVQRELKVFSREPHADALAVPRGKGSYFQMSSQISLLGQIEAYPKTVVVKRAEASCGIITLQS